MLKFDTLKTYSFSWFLNDPSKFKLWICSMRINLHYATLNLHYANSIYLQNMTKHGNREVQWKIREKGLLAFHLKQKTIQNPKWIFKRRDVADITIRQRPLIIGLGSKDPELLGLTFKILLSDCVFRLTYFSSLNESMKMFYFKLWYDY